MPEGRVSESIATRRRLERMDVMPQVLVWIIVCGGLLAGAYAANPRWFDRAATSDSAVPRPWRRLGAAICAVLSVLFPLGLSYLDPGRWPRLYLLYWLMIVLLVAWLMMLAFKDLRVTLEQAVLERRQMGDRCNQNPHPRDDQTSS